MGHQRRAARRTARARRVTGLAPRGAGFTLIEILIVVVMLGILAAIAIPRFSGATTQTREAALKETLRHMRAQVEMFRYQHREVPPGYPGGDRTVSPTEAAFNQQMTLYTDESCTTSANKTMVFRYGPYFKEMPRNPVTKSTRVRVVTGGTMPAAQDHKTYGWIYNPVLLKVLPNIEGADSDGKPYKDY